MRTEASSVAAHDRVEAVEQPEPGGEDVVVVRRHRQEPPDREIDPAGLRAGVFPVAQGGLVGDLGEGGEPPGAPNGTAPAGSASSGAKTNSASGSTKRLTSQADAIRSTCGRGRVTQRR